MEKGGWICSTVPWDSYDIDEHYNVQSCDPMRMFGIHAKAMHAFLSCNHFAMLRTYTKKCFLSRHMISFDQARDAVDKCLDIISHFTLRNTTNTIPRKRRVPSGGCEIQI
jgi:hypothetical protein